METTPVLCAHCGGPVRRPRRSKKLPKTADRWCSKTACTLNQQARVYAARKNGTFE